MKLPLLALLALPYIAIGQSVGDIIIQKATISGATEVYVTPSPTKILGLNDSGEPSLISLGAGVTLPSGTLTISPAWSAITGTPTTLAGYGITDAQPLDTQLTALATLSGTVGTFPYFSSSNVISSGTITAAGRALIDDASAAVQRATLGLGSLATMSLTWLDETSDWTLWSHGIQLGTIKEVPPYVEILETGISFVSDTGGGTITPPTFTGGWAWQLPDKSGTFAFTGDITAALTAYAGSTSLDTLGVVNVGTWNADSIADGYIDSAVTWNNKQDGDTQLTSLSGLSYASNAGKFVRVNGGETGFELATVSGVALGDSPTWTGTHTFASGVVNVYDKLALKTTGQAGDATAFEVITDPANPAVRALRILPPANSGRVYIGKSGQAAYALNLQYCSNIEWCPPVSVPANGIVLGSDTATSISRSADGTQIGANHPGDGGLTIYHAASWASIAASQLVARIHRTSGISFYGTNTSATSYERVSMAYDSGNTCYYIDTQKGAAGGTARAFEIRTDGTTRVRVSAAGEIFLTLPTSAGTSGSLYNYGGTVMVAP